MFRTTASNLRVGDRIRGINLPVHEVIRGAGFTTVLGDDEGMSAATLRDDHRVAVERPFRVGDVVTVPATVFGMEFAQETAVEVEDEDFGTTLRYSFPAVIVTEVDPEHRSITVQTEVDGHAGETTDVAFRLARHAVAA